MRSGEFVERLTIAVADVRGTVRAARTYPWFVRSWWRYSRMPHAEPIRIADAYPQLRDRTTTTPYDPHYFHQAVWAMERIVAQKPSAHVDIGSEVGFVGMVSAVVPVTFVDIRPLPVELPRLSPVAADLARGLPFDSGSVVSLSCLHVVEHIGLGRYGDDLDPYGTERACAELARIMAPGGRLYLSAPVGRPRVCFNAHRIHAPRQILSYFDQLELVEFSVVNDVYQLIRDANLDEAAGLSYGCGLFLFTR